MQNSLPATTTTLPAMPVLSKPLTFWLLEERSDNKSIDVIQASDILVKEARAIIPELRQAALAPATEDQIKATISQRFALFPQPQRNPAEWAAWWADYFDALAGLPAPSVEAGMAAWVKLPDSEFMCKPGKLLDLARTTPANNRWMRAHKIAVAACVEPVKETEAEPKLEEERLDRETVEALMKDFHAQMKAKAPPPVSHTRSIPPPCATVDETGMSAEMRALMQRNKQREEER